VTKIDGDPDFVHLPNRQCSHFAQSGIAGLETTIAKDAAVVVSDLHNAHAQIAEHFDPPGVVFKERGVLKTRNDAKRLRSLGTRNICVTANDHECIGILLRQRLH
jgi:hypothetical protein